jgi:hypothetical protein
MDKTFGVLSNIFIYLLALFAAGLQLRNNPYTPASFCLGINIFINSGHLGIK